MPALSIEQALENIYSALENDNRDIDLHIDALKAALLPDNSVMVDPKRLAQNNRQGRKMMESYFKKRGVVVQFPK